MSFTLLPVSITLLKVVADELAVIAPGLQPGHVGFDQLQMLTKHADAELGEDHCPEVIAFIQILFLVAISLYKGAMTPLIRNLSCQKGFISVQWEEGTLSRFHLGIYEDDAKSFFRFYQRRVFDNPSASYRVSGASIARLIHLIEAHLEMVGYVRIELEKLMKAKSTVKSFLLSGRSDFVFILISALPVQQLNVLLLYVQQFLPDDLEVNTGMGHVVNIYHLFQSGSDDIQFLLDKLMVYYLLYTRADRPIIQEITQSKTRDFLIELLENRQFFDQTFTTVAATIEQQFRTRESLYSLILKYCRRFSA